MSFTEFLFWTLALLTGLCAVGVVVTQNIVRAAAWLLFTLAGTAGIFFLLGAAFVGTTQLIVYVGGILVLVVFGVMLTAQGPFITLKTSPAEWAVALVVGVLFLTVLGTSITAAGWSRLDPDRAEAATAADSIALGHAFLGVKEVMAASDPLTGLPAGYTANLPAKNIPRRTPSGFLLPFEIVSVHLLVVLIGAAYLARAKRRRGAVS